jgi:hypothetical protein
MPSRRRLVAGQARRPPGCGGGSGGRLGRRDETSAAPTKGRGISAGAGPATVVGAPALGVVRRRKWHRLHARWNRGWALGRQCGSPQSREAARARGRPRAVRGDRAGLRSGLVSPAGSGDGRAYRARRGRRAATAAGTPAAQQASQRQLGVYRAAAGTSTNQGVSRRGARVQHGQASPGADPSVSGGDLAVTAAGVPVLSELFGLRVRRHSDLRYLARRVANGAPVGALSPVSAGRLRPRSIGR